MPWFVFALPHPLAWTITCGSWPWEGTNWIGVENICLYSVKEGPTSKPNSSKLGTCQGQKSFTLAHQALFQNQCFQMCDASTWPIRVSHIFQYPSPNLQVKLAFTLRSLSFGVEGGVLNDVPLIFMYRYAPRNTIGNTHKLPKSRVPRKWEWESIGSHKYSYPCHGGGSRASNKPSCYMPCGMENES